MSLRTPVGRKGLEASKGVHSPRPRRDVCRCSARLAGAVREALKLGKLEVWVYVTLLSFVFGLVALPLSVLVGAILLAMFFVCVVIGIVWFFVWWLRQVFG